MGFADQVLRVDRTARRLLGGEPVLYRPGSSGGGTFSGAFSSAFTLNAPAPPAVTVTGIFDASYLLVQGTAEAGVETLVPAVFLELADLPSDPRTDDPILTIGGVDYRVFARRPADFGSIVLALRKVI